MSTIVIDAGHGGHDPGGQSLGRPEKEIAISYALLIGGLLMARGHRVVQTRTSDTFVPLSMRAKLANDLDADLFVSVHANASGNPAARGPWTLHAEGSDRGRQIASSAQAALVEVFGGNELAVYPDRTGWTGGRTLAVLRQTKMPAVLIELGFMTNPGDLAKMTDAATQARACKAIADALHAELGGSPPVAAAEPSVTPHRPVPPPLNLEKVFIPRREHVDEVVRTRGFTRELVEPGLRVMEALLRAVARGQKVDVKREIVKAAADAAADYLKAS